jgi:putative DNA-invertase from lambdoid prophage Rac
MTRTFLYARVSTSEQDVTNQVREIENAGFKIEPHRVISETISGSVEASARPQFSRLLDKLEAGDVLVVSRIDRLGRNSIDVQTTVNRLQAMGVRVHCLQLGGADLTSAAGQMIMGVIASMAQFEKALLLERTLAGQARARAEGKIFGRKPILLKNGTKAQVLADLANGISVTEAARGAGVSRATVMRAKQAATRELGG